MGESEKVSGISKKVMSAKRAVLDTTALIFLNDFRSFEEVCTVQEVVEEVKDRMTNIKLSSMLKDMKVLDPDRKSVDDVRRVAEETGDIKKLTETDIKVLAIAKQTGYTIISDDYNIQNVAGHMKIKYVSIFSPSIKKLIKWKQDQKERKI